MNLHIRPQQTPLRGKLTVPGDKSISHRAVILPALAQGKSKISNWLPAGDTLATLSAIQALGVPITITRQTEQAWDLQIEGQGGLLTPPQAKLDCQNAGSCMRLLAGILSAQPFPTTLDGSPQLRRRPMRRIITPLSQMGANIQSQNGYAPLTFQPAKLHGVRYQMPVASAQVKSGILLAGLFADGDVAIHQPANSRDHTERMLKAMGVELREKNGWIELTHQPDRLLQALDFTMPADLSSAAFLLVSAAIIPHSQLTLTDVGVNPTRAGILALLEAMGAKLTHHNSRQISGEPVADLTMRFSELHSVQIGGEIVVRTIDEFPILTVAATQSAGITHIRDASELRVKEVDRIAVLAEELGKMGAKIEQFPDGYKVVGSTRLQGAVVNSHGDHRLGMALAIAGMVANSSTIVQNADCIADSFPNFVETMQAVGAEMAWEMEKGSTKL